MRSSLVKTIAFWSVGFLAVAVATGPVTANDEGNPFGTADVVTEAALGAERGTNHNEPDITNNIVNNNSNENSGDVDATDGSSAVVGNQNNTASASDNSAAANNGDATVVNADGSEDFVAGNNNTVGMAESNGTIEVTNSTVGDVATGSISDVQMQDARGITSVWSNTGLFNNMINSTVINVNFN
ncbi:MAG: hypothetical protein WDZ84_04245 [Rhodovibrionaceae bacterium]